MVLDFLFFVLLSVATYTCISILGQLTGGTSMTLLQAATALFRPLPFVIMLVANVLFSTALFMGFQVTKFAIPAALACGVITSFIYSVVMLGGVVTVFRLGGVVLILAGIFLLR